MLLARPPCVCTYVHMYGMQIGSCYLPGTHGLSLCFLPGLLVYITYICTYVRTYVWVELVLSARPPCTYVSRIYVCTYVHTHACTYVWVELVLSARPPYVWVELVLVARPPYVCISRIYVRMWEEGEVRTHTCRGRLGWRGGQHGNKNTDAVENDMSL